MIKDFFKKAVLVAFALVFLQADFYSIVSQAEQALDNWDFAQASKLAEQIKNELNFLNEQQEISAHFFLAQYWFYLGEYDKAKQELEWLKRRGDNLGTDFEQFYKRVVHLAELFENAHERSSSHFSIRWVDERDEILAEPALEVLEQAYRALSRVFGFEPTRDDKIPVEIYPSSSDLAVAVGLSDEMLKASGTVAICKYGRLLITTPRVLLYGYDYLTTMSHELVHYFVYSRNGETCPVWLHEGIAKYLETAYKGEMGVLTPIAKSLLVDAIKNNKLITFSEMHPTFAQFKTPSQGQLAFAEVSTMVGYLKSRCGEDSWLELLDLLKQGKDDKTALSEVCGNDFESIWQNWKEWVEARGWKVLPGAVALRLEFSEGKEEKKKEEEISQEELGSQKAWEYVRLGDLLRDRGKYQSAVVEYEKAVELVPYNPKVLNKLGIAKMMAGDYKGAIATLKKAGEITPNYSTIFVNLGLAYASAGDDEGAIGSFKRAVELNPFNPLPYIKLRELYLKQGDSYNAEKMASALEIIKRR